MHASQIVFLLPLVVSGCASTRSFEFPDDTSRRCFVPCESQHEPCKLQCVLHQSGGLLDSIGQLACIASCNSALESCASGCGGHAAGDGPRVRSGPVSSDARRRELRIELLKQEGQYEEMSRDCATLHEQVTARAVKILGKPREDCPPRAVFMDYCLELKPRVARCLRPDTPAKDKGDCEEALRDEDFVPASNMDAILARCYPPKEASQPASQPANQPTRRAPPARQHTDNE